MQAKLSKFLLPAIAFWSLPAIVNSQTLPEQTELFNLAEFKDLRQNRAETLQPEQPRRIERQRDNICQVNSSQTETSDPTRRPKRDATNSVRDRPCQPIEPSTTKKPPATRYFAPRIADDNLLNPLTTTLPLNNMSISHRTNWEFFTNPVFGQNLRQDLGFGGILKLGSQVTESLGRDNIFVTDQLGSYIQLNTVRDRREISTTRSATEKLLGLETKMSLIGNCLFGEGKPTEECSFTPGLVVDRDSIDPATLAPTNILHTSNVGDVVTPESMAAIAEPGFQRGANGQEVGLDLYFPNVGTISRNESSAKIERREEIDLLPLATFSRIRQVVKANDTKAVIGRTIKGTPLVFNSDRNFLESTASALSFFLPDAVPQIAPSKDRFNPNVNQNLFLAANNTRLPSDSYTIYHAGYGQAKSISSEVNNRRQIPSGRFNSLWLGLSPIVDRKSGNIPFYDPHGNIEIIADAGGEGGADSLDVQLVSIVNGDNFASNTLQNVHSQIYIKFFSQDTDVYNTSSLIEKTSYYPHLSFSGNITTTQNVFRYYAGGIIDNPFKAYLGLDYKYQTFSGWNFSTGAIGYLNPDREYYSQLWGNVGKQITFNPQTQLSFFTGFNYAIDRPDQIREVILSSRASSVTLGTKAQWQKISLGASYNFDGLFPNSIESRLILNLNFTVSDHLSLSGYYTPINRNINRSRYGVNASLRFGRDRNNPTLNLGWSNNEYRFENGFTQSDNIYTMIFRLGQPADPFDRGTSGRLEREKQSDFELQQHERVRE